jgi:hypothetical protein
MKRIVVVLFALAVTQLALAAERPINNADDMVIRLEGVSAQCSLDALRLRLAQPDAPSAKAINQGLESSHACVRDGLVKGKAIYQQGLAVAPEVKPQLARIYARWMDYMNSLASYYDVRAQDAAQHELKTAISDMRAEEDAQVSR